MIEVFLGRLLLDQDFRMAAYRDAFSGSTVVLAASDVRRALLRMLPPQRLREISEQLDRKLLGSVLMGRQPEERELLTAACSAGSDDMEREIVERELPRALWRAISDEGFRRACFGDARATLAAAGFQLTEEELGKFRWFDHEKLAKLGTDIAKLAALAEVGPAAPATQCDEPALETEEAQLQALHAAHTLQVEALRSQGRKLLADLPAYAPGEFDAGPPAPTFAQFTGILQLLRWHGLEFNRILLDSGYSLGRLLMLLRELRRSCLELPLADRSIDTDASAVAEWLLNAFRAPSMDERFHQSPCDASAVVARVAHIARHNWLRGREVLVLGDDDGLGLVLARHTEARVHIIDIDDRVLGAHETASQAEGLNIVLHQHDLRERLPAELGGRFTLVSADPPQSEAGERFFLERAIDALAPQVGHRIYSSVTPMWMGLPAFGAVVGHMARRGFASREVLKSQMTFSVRRPATLRDSESPTHSVVHDAMTSTLNMACDIHVFERHGWVQS